MLWLYEIGTRVVNYEPMIFKIDQGIIIFLLEMTEKFAFLQQRKTSEYIQVLNWGGRG